MNKYIITFIISATSMVFGTSNNIMINTDSDISKISTNGTYSGASSKKQASDYASGGGIIGGMSPLNKPKKVTLEENVKTLEQWTKEVAEDEAFIQSSEEYQQGYLKGIQLVSGYVTNYINEKGSCLTLEDDLLMNPPPNQYELNEANEDIRKCYARAEFGLKNHGDIMGTIIRSYEKMKSLQRRASKKMLNIDALNKSIATMESIIQIMKRKKD